MVKPVCELPLTKTGLYLLTSSTYRLFIKTTDAYAASVVFFALKPA